MKQFRAFNNIDFLDDYLETEAIEPCEDFSKFIEKYLLAITTVGDKALLVKWIMKLMKAGFAISTFVHPLANIMATVKLDLG